MLYSKGGKGYNRNRAADPTGQMYLHGGNIVGFVERAFMILLVPTAEFASITRSIRCYRVEAGITEYKIHMTRRICVSFAIRCHRIKVWAASICSASG